MNRLILESSDFVSEEIALIDGSRARHLLDVCKLASGDPVKVGIVNGSSGTGEVLESKADEIRIYFPSAQRGEGTTLLPVTIQLALPRPQMLKRIVQKVGTFGIKRLVLFRSQRVEKSYFHSPQLGAEELKKNLILGLEQGGGTRLPEVLIFPHQRDFFDWQAQNQSHSRYILSLESNKNISDFSILAPESAELSAIDFLIGPEGGFIPKEEEKFVAAGFIPIRVSDSILRVESAFDFIMAQYSLMRLRTKDND
jgi:RsmE family RNA methyltransferase